ncbi:hypothetical protein V1477_005191 [Vespula maculifrons]|uniref:Uncharacterized protein n=1 Tax=Vespula maculifrons TaxID=7453 RepID=A0ABD2CP66_VESMC
MKNSVIGEGLLRHCRWHGDDLEGGFRIADSRRAKALFLSHLVMRNDRITVNAMKRKDISNNYNSIKISYRET